MSDDLLGYTTVKTQDGWLVVDRFGNRIGEVEAFVKYEPARARAEALNAAVVARRTSGNAPTSRKALDKRNRNR